jgi:hypothetical protein
VRTKTTSGAAEAGGAAVEQEAAEQEAAEPEAAEQEAAWAGRRCRRRKLGGWPCSP